MKVTTKPETSYRQSVIINTTPKRAFEALTQEISAWWGDVNHSAESIGDIFKVSWNEPYYQFEVKDLVEDSEIIWDCIDCKQIHEGLEGIEKEWVGTRLFWRIDALDHQQTRVSLHHEGLVPSFICFDVCQSGWDYFIKDSLKSHLENQ